MFLVLVVHADFSSLGYPTLQDAKFAHFPTFMRLFFEALAFVCVNIFVIISGWFSVKLKFKKIIEFIYQSVFILTLLYLVLIILDKSEISVSGIKNCLLLTKDGWFIKSYLFLLLISPVLNSFYKSFDAKKSLLVIFSFFLFVFIFEWTFDSVSYFSHGYSPLFFIGLYLLSRHIRIYYTYLILRNNKYFYLVLYVVVSLVISILAYISLIFFQSETSGRIFGMLYSYLNPLVIISSFSLFAFFSKLHFSNSFINQIAISCFAVYLVHAVNPYIYNLFKEVVSLIYMNSTGFISLIEISLFLIIVFILSVFIDKIQRLSWRFLAYPFTCRIWNIFTKYFPSLTYLENNID